MEFLTTFSPPFQTYNIYFLYSCARSFNNTQGITLKRKQSKSVFLINNISIICGGVLYHLSPNFMFSSRVTPSLPDLFKLDSSLQWLLLENELWKAEIVFTL